MKLLNFQIAFICLIGVACADAFSVFPKYGKCEFPDGKGIIFIREAFGNTKVYGVMNGLTDGLHGFHVHEFGGLGNGCKDAGGHYDPNMVSFRKIPEIDRFMNFCVLD